MPTLVIHDADPSLFATISDLITGNIPGIPVFSGNNDTSTPTTRLILATQYQIEFVPIAQIIRVEGFKNYSTFHIRGRRSVTVSKNLIGFERILPESLFFRVHKSHIVNLLCVMRYQRKGGGALLLEDDSEVPVSPGRREVLFRRLGQQALV
jgi:two-component system, LytTR family, response regulator